MRRGFALISGPPSPPGPSVQMRLLRPIPICAHDVICSLRWLERGPAADRCCALRLTPCFWSLAPVLDLAEVLPCGLHRQLLPLLHALPPPPGPVGHTRYQLSSRAAPQLLDLLAHIRHRAPNLGLKCVIQSCRPTQAPTEITTDAMSMITAMKGAVSTKLVGRYGEKVSGV